MTDQTDRDRRMETLLMELLTSSAPGYVRGDSTLVDAAHDIAGALQRLGNADAATPMGALEAHGATMLESTDKIAGGLHDVAEAIREARE